MEQTEKLMANPTIVFREEFDDWALLFDPDTGKSFGVNPVGAFVWKHMDGEHTVTDIMGKLKGACEDLPADADAHVTSFVDELLEMGLVGTEFEEEDGDG